MTAKLDAYHGHPACTSDTEIGSWTLALLTSCTIPTGLAAASELDILALISFRVDCVVGCLSLEVNDDQPYHFAVL